jgi:hypothetical protein
MALKYKVKTREEIPAEQAALYVERDGAFVLDVEGATDKANADEMRNHNIELRKQIEEFNARYAGIDPEEVRKLAEEKSRLEEERQIKAGEVEKVFENRIRGLKADWDKEKAAMASDNQTMNARLTAIQIDQGVVAAATKRGLRPTALMDITARARSVFKLVNGVPRAFEADGATVRYGRDGVTPMTLEEWVDAQVSDAPHLFESNAGGGAAGNGAGGAAGSGRSVKNPFATASWNLTEQMKLQKSDPQLAARLKAAA